MRTLAAVLQDELATVRELLAVCRQEQEYFKTDDLQGIQAINVPKADLARRLAGLERERQQVLSAAAGETDQVIAQLRTALKQAAQELQEVNETNRLLARQSLAYIQKLVSLLVPGGQVPASVDRTV
jgi:flagellar biosynthesis/type III secretory pathway chaperone